MAVSRWSPRNLWWMPRKLGIWLSGSSPEASPSITAGSAAPTAEEAGGSIYLRTNGGFYTTAGSGVWVTPAAGTDFGAEGMLSDVVAESTAAAGVTVDSVLLKDGGGTFVARTTTTDGVTSGLARVIGGKVYCSVAASAAITGATETETLFDSQISLPAGSLKAGTVVRVRAQGVHTSTTGSETHSIILKIGSVAVCTIALVDPANSDLFYFEGDIVCRTEGASGTIVAAGVAMAAAATAAGDAAPFFLASTTIDTTAANIVGVAIDRQGTATDSDSARLDILVVELIG